MVDRSAHEVGSLCEEQRVDAIDGLSHISHGDLVRVAVEDVEGQAGMNGVAEGNRLAQDVGWSDLRAGGVPHAPLIDDELGAMRRIKLPQLVPVVFDHFLQAHTAQEHFIPLRSFEVSGLQRGGAQVSVEVQAETVGRSSSTHTLKEAGGPADVAVGGMSP